MVTWEQLATAEPGLAETGRSQIFQFGVGLAFLATVRADGAPRVHPVCPVLSAGRLYLLVPPTSPKLHDLLGDGRYALQAFPQPRKGSDELYLAGRAERITDGATRARVMGDARHLAEAAEILFELGIERAMHTRWENVGTPGMRSVQRKWRAPGEERTRTMQGREPMGPFCQSCGMPLQKPEDFGTSSEGIRINDYCHHCFQRGAFTEPEVTREQMVDRCVAIMADRGLMPEAQARALMTEVIPALKRWRTR